MIKVLLDYCSNSTEEQDLEGREDGGLLSLSFLSCYVVGNGNKYKILLLEWLSQLHYMDNKSNEIDEHCLLATHFHCK